VLKTRFLSGNPSPATFLIRNGLLDSVQFQTCAIEVCGSTVTRFYENLVWTFHEIQGGETLPWDIQSVLQILFNGGFQLNVNVGVMESHWQFDCKPLCDSPT